MKHRILNRYLLAYGLIAIGLLLVVFYGLRSLRAYQQFRYIREQGLDRGTASVDAIRPWMPIHYVAVAYAVPEEYIFAQLEIPFERRNRGDTLRQLNDEYGLGYTAEGRPAIVEQVAEAILAYRENPVATGLDDIHPWMSIRYIANSTGVPESILLAELGVEGEPNAAVQPLDQLAERIRFRGGPRGLVDTVRSALRNHSGETP